MDDALATCLMLIFFGACVAGPALGALWGCWKGFASGMTLGCLIIGLTGLVLAASAALHIRRAMTGSETAQGTLVEFVEHSSRDDDGDITTTRVPIVEFIAADGRTRRIEGLDGSQNRSEPGDPVLVHYQTANPDRAVIADVQNVYGIVIGLGLFGLFPTLFGIFFLMEAYAERRPPPSRAPASPSPWCRRLTIAANLIFLGGFVTFLAGERVPVYVGFMTIGVGALLHFVAQGLPPARLSFSYRFIFVIVGLGFCAFGAVLAVLAS